MNLLKKCIDDRGEDRIVCLNYNFDTIIGSGMIGSTVRGSVLELVDYSKTNI